MLHTDLELNDADVVVAHISDLHFSHGKHLDAKQRKAWANLREVFTADLVGRIQLLLVTGDIVDSPHVDDYRLAREAIEDLGFGPRPKPPYFVCRGNHDRHPKGNKLFKPWQWLVGTEKNAHHAFETAFATKEAQHDSAQPIPIHHAGNEWSLGIFGLDSSSTSDWAARGHIDESFFSPLEKAASAMKTDLNLLLIHHHLQPIPTLESRHKDSAANLFRVSSLVNAGQLCEALCRAHIDLVLHGHKHESHWGRYGSMDRGQGEFRILGAGSATGNDSLKGCDPEGASFNLMILSPDRSGRLSKICRESGRWIEAKRIALFTPATVRRCRLLRSVSEHVKQKLNTTVTKHVKFTRDRDVEVHRRITQIKPSKQGYLPISNSTGEPVDAHATLITSYGEPTEVDVGLAPDSRESHTWGITWEAPEGPFSELLIKYTWEGGALLTEEEMDRFSGSPPRGFLRSEGFEYASIQVKGIEAASAELFVDIPEELAPDRVDVFVYDETMRVKLENEAKSLKNSVREIAPGKYWLSVDFPTGGNVYVIAWRPIPWWVGPTDPGLTEPSFGQGLVDRFVAALGSEFRDKISCALYVRESTWKTRRIGLHCPAGSGCDEPPSVVQLDLRGTVLSRAWRGRVTGMLADSSVLPDQSDKHNELVRGEHGLLGLPSLYGGGSAHTEPPWAVMRIGIPEQALEQTLLDQNERFHQIAQLAMSQLLTSPAFCPK